MVKHAGVILVAIVVSLAVVWAFGASPVEVAQATLPTIARAIDLASHSEPAYHPDNNHLWLTVPQMKRVDHLRVWTGDTHDEEALRRSALHVNFTGFPWQHNRNVYIAGHRLGFKNTDSWKVFEDIDELEIDDRIILEDSEGKRYYYRIYKQQHIPPHQSEVMLPKRGKDTVTLQSCTLPDYTRRILVVGERVYGLNRFI
jgi:sortase A